MNTVVLTSQFNDSSAARTAVLLNSTSDGTSARETGKGKTEVESLQLHFPKPLLFTPEMLARALDRELTKNGVTMNVDERRHALELLTKHQSDGPSSIQDLVKRWGELQAEHKPKPAPAPKFAMAPLAPRFALL
jgi:hypothetical protein